MVNVSVSSITIGSPVASRSRDSVDFRHELDLVGSPGWPRQKLQRKLDAIRAERSEISDQLADATTRLATGRQFFLAALELLRDPRAFYEEGGTSLKRAMNKVIFAKLLVDGEEITGHELGEAVRDVIQAEHSAYRRGGATTTAHNPHNASSSALIEDGAAWSGLTEADLLVVSLGGHGSSKTALVEVLRRYSNRPDLLEPVVEVLRRIEAGDRADEPGVCSTGRGGGLIPVLDRLSEADIAKIVQRFRAGVAKHKLAAEYGMSLSTMKRLLRRGRR
jgi:hypothetical protein